MEDREKLGEVVSHEVEDILDELEEKRKEYFDEHGAEGAFLAMPMERLKTLSLSIQRMAEDPDLLDRTFQKVRQRVEGEEEK